MRNGNPEKRSSLKPLLTISEVSISELELNPLNPRVHSDKQIEQLARSIETFGFISPVLIDANRRVIAGHGRLAAMKLLGRRSIPVISVTHLSETQVRAFMIADNRLAEHASWDDKLLGEHFRALAEVDLDFDIEATGFEMAEIDLFIEGLTPKSSSSDPGDEVPEPSSVLVTQLGDIWILNRHRVSCGDARNPSTYFALMNNRRADLVFSDPPYNVKINGHATGLGSTQHREFPMASGEMSEGEFTDFLAGVFELLVTNTLPGSLHYLFMDWRHCGEILAAGRHAYTELKALCVWVKDNGAMGSPYRSQHEFVFVFKNSSERHRNNVQLGKFGRYRTNVWNYPGVNSFARKTDEGNLLDLHPTVKPVALVADAIMDSSARGNIVLDPFLGSGTTVVAAERTGRCCFGLELDPIYVDTIVRRWQRFTGLQAVHAASGHTFDEIEQQVMNEQQ